MKEADLKLAVEEYLQYQQNLGKLMFLRLNSGDFIVNYGASGQRRIRGCPKGTADIVIIKQNYFDIYDEMPWPASTVIFLELKSDKGKQSVEQKEFQEIVERQGCEYRICRSVDEVREIVG